MNHIRNLSLLGVGTALLVVSALQISINNNVLLAKDKGSIDTNSCPANPSDCPGDALGGW